MTRWNIETSAPRNVSQAKNDADDRHIVDVLALPFRLERKPNIIPANKQRE
jgi:hypothetical protein